MPRSKRDKVVSLTKTKKKGREAKEKLVTEIRSAVPLFERAFLFSVEGLRTGPLKELRTQLRKDSRLFFGKKAVMGLALGRVKEEELEKGLHKLSGRLAGQCGLLLTNSTEADVIAFFKTYTAEDFARAGSAASETVELKAGLLPQFPFSIEARLRQLGLPTELQKGQVNLLRDYEVCSEGAVLDSHQAQLLKLLDLRQSIFRLSLLACWTRGHKFKVYKKKKAEAAPGVAMEA